MPDISGAVTATHLRFSDISESIEKEGGERHDLKHDVRGGKRYNAEFSGLVGEIGKRKDK